MPLGMAVGLDPSNIVLDGDSAPPSQKRLYAFSSFAFSSFILKMGKIRQHGIFAEACNMALPVIKHLNRLSTVI